MVTLATEHRPFLQYTHFLALMQINIDAERLFLFYRRHSHVYSRFGNIFAYISLGTNYGTGSNFNARAYHGSRAHIY